MTDLGVLQFYYTRTLPDRAVAIAEIQSRPYTGADLIDIVNWTKSSGSLAVTAYSTSQVYDAKTLGTVISVSGSQTYFIENQFFELSSKIGLDGTVYFFKHRLPALINNVQITDSLGQAVNDGFLVDTGWVYHNFENSPYFISFHDGFRINSMLMQSTPVIRRAKQAATDTFAFSGSGFLVVDSPTTKYLRFRQSNGYQILPPYGVPPNDPWYPRIRFHLRPVAKEWSRQNFYPYSPYQLATWVPGKVLSSNLIEFERKNIFFDETTGQFPDILVYDEKYQLKYALDGVPATARLTQTKGYLFPWKRHQIRDLDPHNARVSVAVELLPTDVVFGFYAYREPDLVYRDCDLNPYTNPMIRNSVVQFFYKTRTGTDLLKNVYHEILGPDGNLFYTSDPDTSNGTKTYFGTLVVGFSVGLGTFTVTDRRVKGGGLSPLNGNPSLLENMWDSAYWDGKPYPLGGSMVILLPASLLDSFSRQEIVSRITSVVPLGTLSVIRYVSAAGEEFS